VIRPRRHLSRGRAGTTAAGLLLVSVAALTGTTLTAGAIMAVPDVQRGAAAPGTVIVDYAVSAGTDAAAVALLRHPRTWATHLVGVGLFAAAAGFNTHAIASAVRVAELLAPPLAGLLRVLLPAVAATLVLLAVVAELAPTAATTARPHRKPAGGGVFPVLAVFVVLAAVAAAAVLPPAAVGVLFLGALTPASGLVCLLGGPRRPSLAAARTRSRPLLALLTGSLVVLAALTTTAALPWLWTLPGPHRTIVDTAGAEAAGGAGPLTLPLWTAQLTVIALAGVMLAQSRGSAARIERRVTRAAAVAIVAAVSTAGFLLLDQAAALITDTRAPGRALALSIAAAVPVALAFLALYTATVAALDRVLYGTRPTPYRVLAGITTGSRVDPVDAPDLDRLVHDVATGLGATRCRLTVRRPGLPDRVHRWPPATAGIAGGTDHPNRPDPAVEVDIRHGDEIVGSLAVDDTALGGPQPQRRRELLTDVADSLGVVLQASRAGVALEQQLRAAVTYATDIAAARRTLVAAMDRERRRIERDLHDGVQHHLTCLRVTLGLVDHQIATAQLGPARSRLDQLVEGLDVAEAVLAETAQGVSAPLLAELGLVQALRTGIQGGDPPLKVDAAPDLDDRLVPRPIAAAVYYCCLEAVGNARKHSPSATIAVHLRPDGDWLRVSVVDDGIGFDTTSDPHPEGRGLRNVKARIGSVGGHVAISSIPGHGTTVEASVPLPRLAAPHPGDPAPHSEQTARPNPAVAQLPARAGAPPASLAARVREALRSAREYYHRTPYAPWLRTLAERLEGPPHIAVRAVATLTTPPGCGDPPTDAPAPADPPHVVLAAALRHRHPALTFLALSTAPSDQPGVRDPTAGTAAVLEVTTEPQPGGDGGATIDHTPPLRGPRTAESPDRVANTEGPRGQAGSTPATTSGTTIVVLGHPPTTATLPDQATRDDQSARTTVPAVVPVDVQVAAAAQNPTPAQCDRLSRLAQHHPGPSPADAPQPRGAGAPHAPPDGEAPPASSDRVGGQADIDRAALPAALALIDSKRPADQIALADQLTTLSGLNRLSALLEARAVGCGDAVAARSVLVELEQLLREQPPAQGADQLWWQLERIRATSHELAELDLIEQLRGGRLPVPLADRGVALRLLGADGADPRTRLALAADADLDQVRTAAAQQRDRWQQLAAHPATTRALRTLAETVARTCTQLHSGQYRDHRHPDTRRDPTLSSDRLWSPDGDRSTAAR
jgi:signal transduction histidine kinase